MLRVIYGRTSDCEVVRATSNYFNLNYKDSWFKDEFVREFLWDIDSVKVVDGELVSNRFGVISPKNLSSGTKVLMLVYFNKSQVFDVSACGDNCAKWILEIGKRRNVTISLSHLMDFKGEFDMEIVNNKRVVKNKQEFLDAILPYIGK